MPLYLCGLLFTEDSLRGILTAKHGLETSRGFAKAWSRDSRDCGLILVLSRERSSLVVEEVLEVVKLGAHVARRHDGRDQSTRRAANDERVSPPREGVDEVHPEGDR